MRVPDRQILWRKAAPGAGGAPGAHHETHEDEGTDEVSIAGLSGTSAALATHKGGADHDGRYYTEDEVDALLAAQDQLAELTDVTITGPADNEVLAYNTATGKWINQTPEEANLVDKSSAQSVAGEKTFTDDVEIQNGNVLKFPASTATTERVKFEPGYYFEMYYA